MNYFQASLVKNLKFVIKCSRFSPRILCFLVSHSFSKNCFFVSSLLFLFLLHAFLPLNFLLNKFWRYSKVIFVSFWSNFLRTRLVFVIRSPCMIRFLLLSVIRSNTALLSLLACAMMIRRMRVLGIFIFYYDLNHPADNILYQGVGGNLRDMREFKWATV